MCEWKGVESEGLWAAEQMRIMRAKTKELWDGEWFVRGFDCSGKPFGSRDNVYGQIYLNAQTWAVLSGLAQHSHCLQAMDAASERLQSDLGLKLLDPPGQGMQPELGAFTPFPAGSRENGGIFHHTNPWAVIAEIALGRADRAYTCYSRIMPPNRNHLAEVCAIEPYVLCQNMLGPDHPRFGHGYNSWLSGTSAWSWVAATQHILGIQPTLKGLRLTPGIPSHWNGYHVVRRFRGNTIHIRVRRAESLEKAGLSVDGLALHGNTIPDDRLREGAQVELVIPATDPAQG